MKRTAMDRARENLRLQQVYNVFLRYGLDSLFNRLKEMEKKFSRFGPGSDD